MVNHCANPSCQKPLHYLREGKIFLFSGGKSQNRSSAPHQLEHFWLCGTCAREWTLTMDSQAGIKLVQTRRKRNRSAYAVASPAPVS